MNTVDKDLLRNGSGYLDPTAYEAIKHVESEIAERERLFKLVGCIKRICELSGYQLEDRITVRDMRTGKIWR